MEFDVKTLGLIYESFHRFVCQCFHEQKFKKVTNVDFFSDVYVNKHQSPMNCKAYSSSFAFVTAHKTPYKIKLTKN